VAVQFSLSYDANGDPVLVENTVSGTRKVVSQSSVVSPYKSRFETPASGDPVTDAEENQPDSNQNAIMDYIMEMEKGADDDPNLSFVQKQNLERYTPEAIERRERKKTRSEEIVETVMKAVLPYADAATAAVKALSAILPQESEEIKAIRQFYADPEQQALVESIPGMSDYNLVYGNPLDPSYGLAGAAQKRIDRINKTLQKKDSSVLRERKKKLQELIDREQEQKNQITKDRMEREDNTPPGIREDTPGGGEFSSPGGGRDMGNVQSSFSDYESIGEAPV
tara:strand:- start:62 stop:904 length:843 start_codon:yes stop_codon:yes gene_type:complete